MFLIIESTKITENASFSNANPDGAGKHRRRGQWRSFLFASRAVAPLFREFAPAPTVFEVLR